MLHANAISTLIGRVKEKPLINQRGYGTLILIVDYTEHFHEKRYQEHEITISPKHEKIIPYLTKGTSVTCICTPYYAHWDNKYTGEECRRHKYDLEIIHLNERDIPYPITTRSTHE